MLEIRINNARFYAYHGVLEYEKEYGNEFQADIILKCSVDTSKLDDDLSKTVDYLAVYNFVRAQFESEKFNLIETLTERICAGILKEFPLVTGAEVRIRKPNAPLGLIDCVEVINKKERS